MWSLTEETQKKKCYSKCASILDLGKIIPRKLWLSKDLHAILELSPDLQLTRKLEKNSCCICLYLFSIKKCFQETIFGKQPNSFWLPWLRNGEKHRAPHPHPPESDTTGQGKLLSFYSLLHLLWLYQTAEGSVTHNPNQVQCFSIVLSCLFSDD